MLNFHVLEFNFTSKGLLKSKTWKEWKSEENWKTLPKKNWSHESE